MSTIMLINTENTDCSFAKTFGGGASLMAADTCIVSLRGVVSPRRGCNPEAVADALRLAELPEPLLNGILLKPQQHWHITNAKTQTSPPAGIRILSSSLSLVSPVRCRNVGSLPCNYSETFAPETEVESIRGKFFLDCSVSLKSS